MIRLFYLAFCIVFTYKRFTLTFCWFVLATSCIWFILWVSKEKEDGDKNSCKRDMAFLIKSLYCI